MGRKNKSSIIGMALIGLFCLAGGILSLYNSYKLYSNGSSAVGTVVDIKERHTKSYYRHPTPTTKYHCIVQFKTAVGQQLQISDSGATPPKHKRGDTVKVLYDAQAPAEACVEYDLWGIGGGMAVFGVVLMLFCIYLWFFS